MNIVLLGAGAIAHVHARAILALRETPIDRDLCLYGVMSPTPGAAAAFAAEFGIPRAEAAIAPLLADPATDAVIICSPSAAHAAQAAAALAAGKHVLCEIPLALSLAEADQLERLADHHDRRLMVCHTNRYEAPFREARRLIATGEVHPHAVISRYLFLRRQNVGWTGRRRGWTDNLLWHHGGHAVDLCLWLLGASAADVTTQIALPDAELGIPLDLTISLRTPRDQLATIVMSYNSHLARHDYVVIGEEATLLVTPERLVAADGTPLATAPGQEPPDAIVAQNAEFFAAIREHRQPAISAAAVRPAMAVLQAAQDQFTARLEAAGPGAVHPRLP